MVKNEQGGRKEASGVWAWKLDTLEPGQTITFTYSLTGLERGDWTDTDLFYRGSQEVIGASKMDEKLLEEIRRQEAAANGEDEPADDEPVDDEEDAEPTAAQGSEINADPPAKTGQQTLMGFGGDE